MTRRLTRTKTKIADAGIPYRVPSGPALTERLPGVLAVLYLLFTHGYNADGEPTFADEAIRLVRLLEQLMPGQPEVSALLALFLFQHSRRDARRDSDGNLLTLDKQDRSRWDHAAIAEGLEVLARTRADGPYALQARIAACHATAMSADTTDWPAIAKSYDKLARIQPSPVIELNRAVAHGYSHGPAAGLALLAEARAGGALDDYPLAIAAEADLTARQGDATAPPPYSGRRLPSPTPSPSAAHCSTAPMSSSRRTRESKIILGVMQVIPAVATEPVVHTVAVAPGSFAFTPQSTLLRADRAVAPMRGCSVKPARRPRRADPYGTVAHGIGRG